MAVPHTHLALPELKEASDTVLKEPKLYQVLFHNDDFTPQDFVTHMLKTYFKKSQKEAEAIMLAVHHTGVGLAGVYPLEIAETKCYKVISEARKNEYPLRCSMEVVDS